MKGEDICKHCKALMAERKLEAEVARLRHELVVAEDRGRAEASRCHLIAAEERCERYREALEKILALSSDRHRFVMMGPRAFVAAENLARDALKGGG